MSCISDGDFLGFGVLGIRGIGLKVRAGVGFSFRIEENWVLV